MATQPGPDRGPFDEFLRWLSADRDLAAVKHEEIRKKIVKYFVRKGCDDPHELFTETIDRVVRILDSGAEYSNPLALCFGVARRVWLEDKKKPKIDPFGDEIPSPPPPPRDDAPNLQEQRLDCLESCMDKLSEGDRDLINRYHEGEGRGKIESRRQLAAEHGGTNTLRIKTFRIRAKLRICVTDCLRRAVN